jgi:hypothetical protein
MQSIQRHAGSGMARPSLGCASGAPLDRTTSRHSSRDTRLYDYPHATRAHRQEIAR